MPAQRDVLHPLQGIAGQRSDLLGLVLTEQPLVTAAHRSDGLVQPLGCGVQLGVAGSALGPVQDVDRVVRKILRVHLKAAGMDHDLAGLQRLHHLQIIGFDKLFPLLLGHVGGTGQAGGTVEHTVQACILDEVLRIIGHRIGDVLQGLVDQLRLLMHQGHHQVVTACGAVTANGVDGAQLLQDAGGAHHSLEHGDVLVQTSLHLLNDLDLLCKHALIARQHRDLFQIRHTANGTLYHLGKTPS